jgi:20S proteasome, alpha and beta subunits
MIKPTTAFTSIIIFLLNVKLYFSSPYSSLSHPLLQSLNQNDNYHHRHRLNGGRAMITAVCTGSDDASFLPLDVNLDFEPRYENLKDINDVPTQFSLEDTHWKLQASSFDENEIRLAINIPTRSYNEQKDDLFTNIKRTCLKTGTTIVGVQTRQAIILAADTRATEGSVVADTRCEKVHQLCQNVWCCGAGTSGDLDALARKVRYTFLLRTKIRDTVGNDGLNANDLYEGDGLPFQSEEEIAINQNLGKAGIAAICHFIREELTKGGGQIGANLVLGGVDPFTDQPCLVAIHPHGSIDVVPYTALGSGGLSAMGVLESRYHVDMTMEEGIDLVKSAVLAGIKNDLGSGSQVCVCTQHIV